MTKSLSSFGALAKSLMQDSLKTIIAAEVGLRHAAKIVQEDAKSRIGEYQGEIGPFPNWEELAESTKADRVAHGYTENDPLLRSGELRESIVTEHNAMEAIVGSKMPIAKYQEVGTEKIPPRPFLGPAAYSNSEKIVKTIGTCAVSGMIGGTSSFPVITE